MSFTLPLSRDVFFIGGEWVAPSSPEMISIISPRTEEVVGTVPAGQRGDIDRAVAAARKAFDHGPWPRMSVEERGTIMRKVAAYMRERGPEVAKLVSTEMGGPMSMLGRFPDGPGNLIDYYADLAKEVGFAHSRVGQVGPAVVRNEPMGVIGAITPWNGPLTLLLMKFAPALMAGCTMVSKPSPEAPLDAYVLADACAAAGLPAGVFNLVPAGREAGEHLVSHQDIDKIAFTGSTAAGRRIAEICGRDLRRVSLELGGKSALIALDDADAAAVAKTAIPFGLGFNSGQACAALTRILVPARRQAEFVEALSAQMETLVTGDPFDLSTTVGPMVAERQRSRIEGLIATAIPEGARLVRGGSRPADLPRGWFVAPTLFSDVKNEMTIAREEIFGPVGVVIPYEGDDEEAIRIANDTPYGLAGAVFSPDVDRAYSVCQRVRAGTYGINTFYIDPRLPFGGFKASGIGRENGKEGLLAFTETKTVLGLPEGIV